MHTRKNNRRTRTKNGRSMFE